MLSAPQHFLDLHRIDAGVLRGLLHNAAALKERGRSADLAGCTLAMIFEKPSTRTRVSFAAAMNQMGGQAIELSTGEMQLGRGETIEDTARVLSRYVDAILLRTDDEAKLHQLAEAATAPVINGLTNRSHPCQILADLLTVQERHGRIEGLTIAWIGDFNNVARSFAHAAPAFGFRLVVASPESLGPDKETADWAKNAGAEITTAATPQSAVADADVVVTDTWVSMGDKGAEARRTLLRPYQVNEALMADARPDTIFLHCLPAHRGEEVTDAVLDGPRSAVWDEAENRLYAQKAILRWCIGA